jgi:SAM-dependent methyltransferase
VRADARALAFHEEFDVAISLCQGAFGLGGPAGALAADREVLAAMARAVRPGGRLVVSAFSAYFQVRYLEGSDSFDAATGVNHERTTLRSESGEEAEYDLWTTCLTPRELTLLAEAAGLSVDAIWSVTPGAYAPNPPDLDHPEFLLVADKVVGEPH